MPANIREMLIAFSKNKQAAIATANTVSGMWRMNKINTSFGGPKLNTENDAAELGKGNEFAANVYKTYWDVTGQLEKYLSAEFAAWAMVFGLGKCTKTGTTHLTYTCTPLDPVTDGIELPYFSFVEQIRPGGSAVLDRMAVGCAVQGFTLAVASGPGRANSKLTVDYAGSGKHTSPSGITIPSATTEHLLSSASLAFTSNSIDYVTAKSIVSLELGWKNNLRLDAGFYPGSGFLTTDPTSGAIRGRMEVGDRELTFPFTARFDATSTELALLEAGTEGTSVLSLTYDTNNSLAITLQRVQIQSAELGESDGLVTVEANIAPLWHSTNGLITAVAKCDIDGIGVAES
jgi:hypothetical protein